jgi:hypothetical protein
MDVLHPSNIRRYRPKSFMTKMPVIKEKRIDLPYIFTATFSS